MGSEYPLVVVAPIVGLAADCISHIGLAKAFPSRGPYGSMVAGILVGLVVSLAITGGSLRHGDFGAADCVAFHLLNVMSYLALAFGYFNFINLTIASLRIRLLRELSLAGGSLERSRMLDTYNTNSVIALRIERLIRGGHFQEQEGRYFIGKRRFLAIAIVYNFLRWLVIGPWPRNDAHDHA